MAELFVARERLKVIYGKYEIYIKPALKFLLAMITMMMINKDIGYMESLNRPAVLLIVSLFCSFMPINMIVVFAALFVVLNVYALSMECAIVVLVMFLLMFLMYIRFSPKDTLAVLLTPVAFVCRVPYAVPICGGLTGTPSSAVAAACGVIVYYVLNYIKKNNTLLGNLETETTVERFKMIIDGIMKNRDMIIAAGIFAAVLIAVYLIRRLSADNSWKIAITVGAVLNIVMFMVGDVMFDMSVSIPALLLGSIGSAAVALVLEFFAFSVDYTRTEHVQFEDDEYYYYVKAVPKIMVSIPSKKVKQINPPEHKSAKKAGETAKFEIKKKHDDEDGEVRQKILHKKEDPEPRRKKPSNNIQ